MLSLVSCNKKYFMKNFNIELCEMKKFYTHKLFVSIRTVVKQLIPIHLPIYSDKSFGNPKGYGKNFGHRKIAFSLFYLLTGCVYIFGHHLQSDSLVDCKNPRPVIVKNLPPISSIAAGYGYSLFVDFDGNVWILGSISKNQKCFCWFFSFSVA